MNNQDATSLTPGQFEDVSALSDKDKSFFSNMKMMNTGLLSRGLLWIQSRNVARTNIRRLHVCATVALGEKRFVSVIECDGLKFLIGGGAATVSMLAQLPSSMAETTVFSSETDTEVAL